MNVRLPSAAPCVAYLLVAGIASGANQAPSVTIDPVGEVYLSDSPVLRGNVEDDGLPAGATLTHAWIQASGTGIATFADPDESVTLVSFDAVGTYVLRLTVSDGQLSGAAEVTAEVVATPSVTVISPNGGEVWYAGTTRHIVWESVNVNDVFVSYSSGAAFEEIGYSDVSSPDWQAYPWVVPDDPSVTCSIIISGYMISESDITDADFEIRRASDDDSDMDGIGDYWELDTFGDLDQDDTTDSDGDGRSDYEEFMDGTDPLFADAGDTGDSDGAGSCAPGSACGTAAAICALMATMCAGRLWRTRAVA